MNPAATKLAAESLQNLMLAIGRGGDRADPSYKNLRQQLLDEPAIQSLLPSCVTTCRDGLQFWAHVTKGREKYAMRDQYVWESFGPLLDYLERSSSIPGADMIAETLKEFDSEHVYSAWNKAIERQKTDPEAALTSARTLLESTCKHILDGLNQQYDDKSDLPELYSAVAKCLNLSPSLHTEQIFKQILSGCHSVVVGIGALRNKLSDAHGKGATAYKPAPRHSALAVNLSGAMSVFLVETYEAKKEKER
jgi:hypothetical protein